MDSSPATARLLIDTAPPGSVNYGARALRFRGDERGVRPSCRASASGARGPERRRAGGTMTQSGSTGSGGGSGWTKPPMAPAVPGPSGFVYADVPNRVIAFIIDAIIIGIIDGIVFAILSALG